MTEKPQLKLVNRSGYPLQIAIARAVKQGSGSHGWTVLYEEHSWKGADREGFIDIALEHDNLQVVLIVECKRLQDAEWIFFSSKGNADLRRFARAFRVERKGGKICPNFPIWADAPADPRSPIAEFCVMPKD